MLLAAAALIVGFVVLAWSADRFVFGAAATARNLGVSPLVVGLTIVGFGTSAPELLIAGFAALQGAPELAIGNAVGSNIANIGLVLGTAALVSPLAVRSKLLKREYMIMAGAMGLAWVLMLNESLGRIEGAALIGALLSLGVAVLRLDARRHAATGTVAGTDPLDREYEREFQPRVPLTTACAWLAVGLLLLLASSRVLVWGATEIAEHFGISDLVIGLTVVAVGTSLPEVATSVAASLKGEDDIAVGNVLGSNVFNMLGVIGVAALLQPFAFGSDVLWRDFLVMAFMSGLLARFAFTGQRVGRIEGGLLLGLYAAYLLFLGYTAAA